MWAWRILRRLTTSVICIRVLNSLGLSDDREDADLTRLQIVENRRRASPRAGAGRNSSSTQNAEEPEAASSSRARAARDFERRFVGDERHLFGRLDRKARHDRIARALSQLRVERNGRESTVHPAVPDWHPSGAASPARVSSMM